ncbi:IclR family transcriptional regulator [Bosea sp. 2RAB26]|uniref:IclR family transcriptional regulator n=1 Tax=Bosea sp. 2RAB26 TaxID=3237476 RepID=UPI003F910A38
MKDSEMGVASAPSATGPRRTRVSGIERSVQILDYLQETARPATGYDIARAVGAPLSTVYSIVEELVARDLLSSNGSVVWLGPKLYHYGLAYARDLEIITVATHEMHVLSREVGETVQICGRDGDMMVVEAMAEGPGHFKVTSRIGTRVPLNWTASGRLLVAHLDFQDRVALFRRCAKASPTGRATVDPVALAEQSDEALSAGIAVQAGESDYAVACVAAPVRNNSGDCVITISIVLPEFKVQEEPSRFADAVRSAAQRIEASLGWQFRQ